MSCLCLIELTRDVLRIESEAISLLTDRLDHTFETAVQMIVSTPGRVVVTGMGKSGAIARKAAATFASTGTPAFHLHPAEGVHGDLGMITPSDLVLALSYSGETDEILAVLPAIQRIGAQLVAMTSRPASTLGRYAHCILDVTIPREACPHNLAPTASTTAMLALTDALAIAAMRVRDFTPDKFALYHPAGSLGRRLLLTVGDLMRAGDRLPLCGCDATVWDAMFVMTRAESGCVLVVDAEEKLSGVLTDGDVRRLMISSRDSLDLPVGQVANQRPRCIAAHRLASEAMELMQTHPPCSELPVLDEEGRPQGILNLKDALRAGL